ncbi:hypothetical protein B0H11DRAFT_132919 [Mycena galericulata]|nr:hypothetical protein B0H11DRAFT_132919 [Mycena galericulata]
MALLGGALGGLLGGGEAPSTDSPVAAAGLLPTLSIPTLPTLSLPGISLPGLPTLSPASSPPSAPSSSLPTSSPVSSVPPSISSTPSSSVPSLTATPPASTPTVSTTLQDVTSTGPNGVIYTETHVLTATPSASQSASAAPAHNTSFLQNKALSGTVFALAGLLGLILIVVGATFFLRRRARNRLFDDAVSFDPGLLAAADHAEKGHSSNASLGTMGSGRPVPGYGTYGAEPVRQQYPEYYSAPQNVQQPYYSAYVPPMAADAPPATAFQQHNIPRVPVPPGPLPSEFGSSSDQRRSTEEAEFWARTLKVTNE